MKKAQSGAKVPKKAKVKMATEAEKMKNPQIYKSVEGKKAQAGAKVTKKVTRTGNTAAIPGAGQPRNLREMLNTNVGKTYKSGGKMGKCKGGC